MQMDEIYFLRQFERFFGLSQTRCSNKAAITYVLSYLLPVADCFALNWRLFYSTSKSRVRLVRRPAGTESCWPDTFRRRDPPSQVVALARPRALRSARARTAMHGTANAEPPTPLIDTPRARRTGHPRRSRAPTT